MSRKALTAAVVAATIAWSISLSAFLAPLTAKAAASGSLVKASLPAVYYVGADGKRYVFPNEKTYKTWYADFSGVMIITDSELASMAIGGNVTYKPGVRMVKIQSDPKTYAVDNGGVLRWVKSEAVAVCLYGSAWNTMIDDVSDAFFTNYTVGADINACSDFSPASEAAGAGTINTDKGLSGSTSVSGTFQASLSSSQPAGGTLPAGATQVNMLKVDVKNAGSSSMTVDSLTVHRSGAGASTDIAQVYVYAGNDRLTTGRSINSSTNDASFSGLNLSLAAGETKTLWIAGDINTATTMGGNQNRLELKALTSGTTSASGLPLMGPLFTMSSASVGSVTIAASGSITNPKAGQSNAKIGEFQLTAGSQEDITFSKIALFQGGAISRDKLTNFVLKQAGLTIATVSALNGKDLAAFVLANPMLLEKGSTKTFEVYADISGAARTTDTVRLFLDQASDLLAVGSTYGYGVQVTNTLYDGATCPSDCSSSTVDAGQLTLTFNGPAAKDVASNGKDIEVFNFTMAAQSNLEVRKLQLVVDGNGDLDDGATTSPRLTDIKVVDTATGVTVSGPKDSTQGTGYVVANNSATLDFTEVFNLSAGQARTFKVTVDVANDATLTGGQNLTTVKVTLTNLSSLSNAVRNLDNSTYLTAADMVPSANMAGNTHAIKSPSLTLSTASTPVSQTYIQGSQGVALLGLSLKAGDAGSVKVNSVKLTCFIDDVPGSGFAQGTEGAATCSSDLLSAKLWNGTAQLGDTESPAAGASGVMTFDNLNLTIAAGQTVTLSVTGNLAASIASVPDKIKLGVAANGDVTATDQDGNSLVAGTNLTGAPLNSALTDTEIRMTIAAAGTITVAQAPSDSESEAGNVVGGASNVVLAKYRFTAQNEELKLTKARIAAAAASVSAFTSVSLYDGATLIGGPTSLDSNGFADFTGMNFVIPKDASKTLTVKANLSTVGTSGAASGLDLTVRLCDGLSNGAPCGATDPGTFEVRGTSAGSSTQLTSYVSVPTDLAGFQKIIRKTKPTFSNVALPTTSLNDGTVVLARFTVSADAADQVSLKKITFNVTKTAAIVANTANGVREVGQGSDIPAAVTNGAGCAAAATACVIGVVFTDEQVIAAGTSKTYELRSAVTATAASSTMSTVIATDTVLVTGELEAAGDNVESWNPVVASAAYNLIWSDNSGIPHDDVVGGSGADDAATNDWTNGKYVKTLPSDAQTLTRS